MLQNALVHMQQIVPNVNVLCSVLYEKKHKSPHSSSQNGYTEPTTNLLSHKSVAGGAWKGKWFQKQNKKQKKSATIVKTNGQELLLQSEKQIALQLTRGRRVTRATLTNRSQILGGSYKQTNKHTHKKKEEKKT